MWPRTIGRRMRNASGRGVSTPVGYIGLCPRTGQAHIPIERHSRKRRLLARIVLSLPGSDNTDTRHSARLPESPGIARQLAPATGPWRSPMAPLTTGLPLAQLSTSFNGALAARPHRPVQDLPSRSPGDSTAGRHQAERAQQTGHTTGFPSARLATSVYRCLRLRLPVGAEHLDNVLSTAGNAAIRRSTAWLVRLILQGRGQHARCR